MTFTHGEITVMILGLRHEHRALRNREGTSSNEATRLLNRNKQNDCNVAISKLNRLLNRPEPIERENDKPTPNRS